MATIYLVRHGEAEASWGEAADPGLSALGLQQAHEATDYLESALPDGATVLSSPLRRARETATPLAERWQSVLTIDPVFREVPSMVPFSQRRTWLDGFLTGRWSEQPSELSGWRQNILSVLAKKQADTVIFTHFVVINAVLGAIAGDDRIVISRPAPGSLTELETIEGQLRLKRLGEQIESFVN